MATTLLFVSLAFLSVAYCQLGLPCLQRETLERKLEECFGDIGGSNTNVLHFADGSGLAKVGSLLSEEACRNPDDIVNGLDCFYDFWGDCFNIREVLPGRPNIQDAIKDACTNVKAITNSCVKSMVKDMTVCLLQKVQERQTAILTREVKVESTLREACRAYTYEEKCLKKGSPVCPAASREAFLNFMKKLVPQTCRYPGLVEVLKNNYGVKNLGMTRMKSGPR